MASLVANAAPYYLAVFQFAGASQAEVCAAVRSAGGDAYGKWLNNTADPNLKIEC